MGKTESGTDSRNGGNLMPTAAEFETPDGRRWREVSMDEWDRTTDSQREILVGENRIYFVVERR